MTLSTLDLFTSLVKNVIDEEGGYSNNPKDPGGETKYGISKRAFPNEDIANLTVQRATDLYFENYWEPLGALNLPPKLHGIAFECAVNQGLGKVKSLLTPAILAQPEDTAVAWFLAERALAYAALPTFPTFGRGWLRRLFKEALSV